MKKKHSAAAKFHIRFSEVSGHFLFFFLFFVLRRLRLEIIFFFLRFLSSKRAKSLGPNNWQRESATYRICRLLNYIYEYHIIYEKHQADDI